MTDKFNFVPGEYKVLVYRLNVRGTPDTQINNLILNPQGQPQRFTLGQSVPVYRIVETKSGWKWGVINKDGDKDHLICLWDLNTRYVELVKPFEDKSIPEFDFLVRLSKLEEWARIQGYKG